MTYEYFLTKRGPANCAIPSGYELIAADTFEDKIFVRKICCEAYGVAFYRQRLPKDLVDQYALVEGDCW